MGFGVKGDGGDPRLRSRVRRLVLIASVAVAGLAFGAATQTNVIASAAFAEAQAVQLPAPPPGGVMGFVVHSFVPAVIQGKDACPEGIAIKTRDRFLMTLPPAEQERIQKKENEAEFMRRYIATVVGPNGTNICSQYSMFPDRPTLRTVQSKYAMGIDLDGDGAGNPEGCANEGFQAPDGRTGIDNQAYRALGCKLEWRGLDGTGGDIVRGLSQFFASGEFTQVLLLRGVDSLVNDDNVEVIYGNTPDRPSVDASGKFVWGSSFTISDKAPRHRNVLRGRIVNGVLTTDPQDIKLTQTWGQSAQRDLRGIRSRWDIRRARLRLAFQPDGTLKGVVGGYQPLGDLLTSPSLGGMGTLINAGIDCAGEYNTLKKLADGDRDPRTGQCTTISTGLELQAVPAFVNDLPVKEKIASK